MAVFWKKAPDIHRLVEEAQATPGALLVDVRTDEEYRSGHIPGSIHLEAEQAARIVSLAPDRSTPLYVYCLSGSRSARACAVFERMGYARVKNIGGITAWKGALQRETVI